MAATDSPSTLSELRTTLGEGLKEHLGSSAVSTILDRYLNMGLQDMHQESWPWAERQAVLQTHPGYSTGTVAIALEARTTVTGTDTLWDTAVTGMGFDNVRAGGKIVFAGETEVYTVSSVTNDTSLVLTDVYVGSTALSGATYAYFEDEYAPASDFDHVFDTRYFSESHRITIMQRRDFFLNYPQNTRGGQPSHAAVVDRAPVGSAERRQRILLGPRPNQTYRIPYRYSTTLLAVSSAGVGQANLSASTDQPIVPLKYRMGIVYKALKLWAEQRQRNSDLAMQHNANYEALMLRARQNVGPADDRPRMVPRVRYQDRARYAVWAGGARRSDGGVEWDQLKE